MANQITLKIFFDYQKLYFFKKIISSDGFDPSFTAIDKQFLNFLIAE